MKKIIITTFLMVFMLARGQDYVPLLDTNKVWNIFEEYYSGPFDDGNDWGATYPHYLERCEIDTTRFIVKKKYTEHLIMNLGYLHEDTAAKKVYYTDMHGNEMLLYDFNLVEGDGFLYYNVSTVDSVQLLDGTYRKRISFYDWENLTWIEGIGSIWGGLIWTDWGFKSNIPAAAWLLCYYENDTLLYKDEMHNTCNLSYSTNSIETFNRPGIPEVYPNPFSQKLSISFDSDGYGEKSEVIVKTLDGRVIYKESINLDIALDLSFLDKGIYLLVFINKDFQYTQKIIKL